MDAEVAEEEVTVAEVVAEAAVESAPETSEEAATTEE
jgi:hypothetical protein